MAKGKHVVADVASDQEAYLKDEYDELFAEMIKRNCMHPQLSTLK